MFGVPPNLISPRTFNEKLHRSKFTRRKARYTQFADKIAVRQFVADKVGAQCLPKVFWTGASLLEAKDRPLPARFVVKCNHLSGVVLLVQDASTFDWDEAHAQTQDWLRRDFSLKFGEWQYRWIKPQLLIEEFLGSEPGISPPDYKFYCFGGRAELIVMDFSRYSQHSQLLLDRDFNVLPVTRSHPRYEGMVEKPACFEEMRRMAETLAQAEPFVRVDLYAIGNRPIFGELTLTPGAGIIPFDPPSWDERLGALIR